MLRHLPNALTASRGLAGLVVAWLLTSGGEARPAFWVFIAAMLTDLFDGALARRLGATGELGRWLDPIADKVLTNACWLALWAAGWAPGWLALPVVLRDVAVALGFVTARFRGLRYEVNLVGRLAVSFEGIALAVLLFHGPWIGVDWPAVGTALGVVTLILSFASVLHALRTGPTAEGPTPR